MSRIAKSGSSQAIKLATSAALDFPSVGTASFSDLTVSLTGAVAGDAVVLGVPTAAVLNNLVYFAWVSAPDTVTVRCVNNDGVSARDPASGTFKVTIIR